MAVSNTVGVSGIGPTSFPLEIRQLGGEAVLPIGAGSAAGTSFGKAMKPEEYEDLIEGARNDAGTLGRIIRELQGSDEPALKRLCWRASSLKLVLMRKMGGAAASKVPGSLPPSPSWLSDLGIAKVDGRPLYRYRLSDDAFVRLQAQLRASAAAFHGEPEWRLAAKFTLWASEWFRR